MSKKYTSSQIVHMMCTVHDNKYLYPIGLPENRKKEKLEIICHQHGRFYQNVYNHLKGQDCPKCFLNKQSKRFRRTTDQFIKKSILVHGTKYDYSLVNYTGKNVKVKIVCEKHGEFFQQPSHHLNGSGCAKCAGTSKSTTEEFMLKSNNLHDNFYNYSKVKYINAKEKVEIVCPKHGSFFIRPNDHLFGQGCMKCSNSVSNLEIKFLNEIGVTKENRQIQIGKYIVDGVDSNNIVYEFLGDFWHGNPIIFKKEEIHPLLKVKYGELYDKTFKRFDTLVNMGYSIRYIWENDWRRWKQGTTKKLLIKTYE